VLRPEERITRRIAEPKLRGSKKLQYSLGAVKEARAARRSFAGAASRSRTPSGREVSTMALHRVGNVAAAVCSFFIPGLGQLLQRRGVDAVIHFVLALLLWLIWIGWIIHLYSAYEAAVCRW
jgi:uncharacterized membrane protein YqaE (UPF0057 family)